MIGHAYEYLSVFEKAEPHYRRAWDLRSGLLGPDHPETLASRNRYVFAVAAQGGRSESEELARSALRDCERALGDAHPETGDAANILAEVFAERNRPDEAVDLRRRASRIMNAALGANHEKTLKIDNNLGVALVASGRPAEGVSVLQSPVDRLRRAHPAYGELGTNLGNLGGAMIAAGRFADAEATLREAIPLCVVRLGPSHRATYSARNLLCAALEGQGRFDEAESGYLSVLVDRRKLPSQRPLVGRTLGGLVRTYAKQRRWSDAARYLSELVVTQNPGKDRTPEALAGPLAAALEGTADPAAASPLLRESWEVLKLRMWAGDSLTSEVASRHGDCLRRLRRFAEAEPILVGAADEIRKGVGVPAWGVDASRRRVAERYDAWGKPAEAAKWR